MSKWIKAYKGFSQDMKCRDFQFEEGKEYSLPDGEEAKLCENGFHACEAPIDCLSYYEPAHSVYHEVELEATDEKEDDSKRVGKRIKIGAKISIGKMVEAQFEYVKEHVTNEGNGHTTDARSANSATGYGSANSATGYRSANSATGYGSGNSATGYGSANSATGDRSANSATGDRSANSATGYRSANSATGYGSANVTTGENCANKGAEGTINVGWGKDNKCKGKIGAYLVLCERADWDGNKYPMIGEPVLVKVDGKMVKTDTWYMLKNGEIVEADDD